MPGEAVVLAELGVAADAGEPVTILIGMLMRAVPPFEVALDVPPMLVDEPPALMLAEPT